MTDASGIERRLLDVIEDHAHEYLQAEIPDHAFGDPVELRDLTTGQTFLIEVRALPTGG